VQIKDLWGFLDTYAMEVPQRAPNILLLVVILEWEIWFSKLGHDKCICHTPMAEKILINHLCSSPLFGPDNLPLWLFLISVQAVNGGVHSG
jgi:hypothetical protein